MLTKDNFMIFVIKRRLLLPENLLRGIFWQLLGSETINIGIENLTENTQSLFRKSQEVSARYLYLKWVKIEKS